MILQYDYRLIYHQPDGKARALFSAEDTPDDLARRLDHLVDSGLATGGHIEVHVDGIGWVVCDEEEA